MSLLYGSILSLTRLPRKTRHIPQLAWVNNYAYMLRMSLVAYAVGSLFLGLTYWSLLYHLVFIAVLVRKFALEELASYESASTPAVTASGDQLQNIRQGRKQYAAAVARESRAR
jgi:hypothetical protein